jgi:hypothetical protein
MLLRQKAIVEGGLSLILQAAGYSDRAEHHPDPDVRRHNQRLLDVLTPVAKSFPAERGYEANTLALQIHGGYGYSSEYLPEAWLRDQKLNSIHEGTTGIHGLDLLGRRALADGALMALGREMTTTVADARAAGVDPSWLDRFDTALQTTAALTVELATRGQQGDPAFMLRHSTDFLDLFSTVVIAWQWLRQAAVAARALPHATPIRPRLLRGQAVRRPVLAHHRAPARRPPRDPVPHRRGLVRAHAARVVLTRVPAHLLAPLIEVPPAAHFVGREPRP